MILTVERGSEPMKDRSPEVYPADKPEVIGRVGLVLYDVINCLVENSDGT